MVKKQNLPQVAQEPIDVIPIEEQTSNPLNKPQTAKETLQMSETPAEQTAKAKQSKLAQMVELLQSEDGIPLKELAAKLNWLENSVRGAMSLYVKKHKEYTLTSEKSQGTRIYRFTKTA